MDNTKRVTSKSSLGGSISTTVPVRQLASHLTDEPESPYEDGAVTPPILVRSDRRPQRGVVRADEKSQPQSSLDEKMSMITPSQGLWGPGISNMSISLRGLLRTTRRKGSPSVYRFNTCERVITNGTSGTFYAPVKTLQPNNTTLVTESTALSTLFDEFRCTRVTVHSRTLGSTAIGAYAWALAYDPGNSAPYVSVVGTLLAKQHEGPVALNQNSSNSVSLQAVNSSGYRTWDINISPAMPTAGASTASETVGSNWTATSDTSATIGYIKAAIDAVTSVAVTLDLMIIYHMEYRSRS